MKWQRILAILGAVALGAGAWRAGGWQGLALLGSGLMLWVMLYYTRLMTIMKRAVDRPIGYVGSAVMLNAKLKRGQPLLTVLALNLLGAGLRDALDPRLAQAGIKQKA